MFSAGAGIYNRNTADGAIDERDHQHALELVHIPRPAGCQSALPRPATSTASRTNKAYDEIQDRLRKNPNTLDITDGDALNVLLDVLLNPATADQSLQLIKTPLRAEVIANIPFEVATECITVCLASMTTDGEWPLQLRGELFRPEREALQKAIQNALKEDETGNLEPETIDAVQKAITNLRLKFVKQVPQDAPDYVEAQNKIKAMAGLIKMLDSSKIEKVLAELEDYQGTTLGDLLAFMQAFNLRFSAGQLVPPAANLPEALSHARRAGQRHTRQPVQRRESRGSPTRRSARPRAWESKAVGGLKSAAIDVFKDLGWDRF